MTVRYRQLYKDFMSKKKLKDLAQAFINALSSNDPAQYALILSDDVGLRVWNSSGIVTHRPRTRVIDYFMEEWSAWNDAMISLQSVITIDERIAIEYRIQATENGRYVEHNRAAFLALKDGQIETADFYYPAPILSARREGWVVPANISANQVRELFATWKNSSDVREFIPRNNSKSVGLCQLISGNGSPHPGSNSVSNVNWSTKEADTKIEEIIGYHRKRNIGFQWFVDPTDKPRNLRKLLERHGLILAGDAAMMARVNLNNLGKIPVNSDVQIEVIDGTNDDAIEARLQILGKCFNWTKEQIDFRRPNYFERAKDPRSNERGVSLLARFNGIPVAQARVSLCTGIAYLGGASTLPDYRGQHIYSTMLRRRLEIVRERGYNIAMIHAEPMSRRVVSKYGFKEYGRSYLYCWMPVIDMKVIKSLVPDV